MGLSWLGCLVIALVLYGCSAPPRSVDQSSVPEPASVVISQEDLDDRELLVVHQFYHARANGQEGRAQQLLGPDLSSTLRDTRLSLRVALFQGVASYSLTSLGAGKYVAEITAIQVDTVGGRVRISTYQEHLTARCDNRGALCNIVEFQRADKATTMYERGLAE